MRVDALPAAPVPSPPAQPAASVGEALPEGAVARLGTVRFRSMSNHDDPFLVFSPDGAGFFLQADSTLRHFRRTRLDQGPVAEKGSHSYTLVPGGGSY